MKAEQPTVLDFIENPPKPLPTLVTVRRTEDSRHQFRLLTRATANVLKIKPINATNEKGAWERTRAMTEELSLFDQTGARLFALEGFSEAQIRRLAPAPKTYIVAETDEGTLLTTPATPRKRRDILKVLTQLLEEELKPEQHYSLRELKKLGWASLTRFEEYETLLRKAYLMGWDEKRIGQELTATEWTNLLTATKRSDFKPIFDLMGRIGAGGTLNRLIANTADLIHYRALKRMGWEGYRLQREMGISDRRTEELEEAARTLTEEDLRMMAERTVALDQLTQRAGTTAVELMLLNAPTRVKR